ncbi:MAG: hypothetical protein QGH39_00165 [Candidatus Thermoplasmatota archaeon]|nr:hypothetical protein [Candidatus Thermoplasmatota archaeon]
MIGSTNCSLKKVALGFTVTLLFLLPVIIDLGNPFYEGRSHISKEKEPEKNPFNFLDIESGGSLGKTRSTLFEEVFENFDNLDNASTTALISDGKATLSRTPAPDSKTISTINLAWLSEPVHTYPFHPNAMTYDPLIPCLVLSLQGPKALYRVSMDDGNKLDEIPTISNNNSGIAFNGDYYYYSVGADTDASKSDVYKYDKKQEQTTEYISSKSNKDGYPLTVVGNYIYRGKSYDDGSEDWGKINKLEKVSMAEPDKVLSTYPLNFTGMSDLAYDGTYIWVLVNSSNKVSLYQFDTDGNRIGEFKDFYTPRSGLKPCGLAYVGGTGDEEDCLYVLLYKERGGPDNSQLLKIKMTSRYTLKDTIYSNRYDFAPETVNAVKFEATSTSSSSTSIEYFYSTENGANWKEANLNEWIDFEEPVNELSYKISLSTQNQAQTPTLSNLKVLKNVVESPLPGSPTNNVWTNDPKVNFKWTFNDPNDSDGQTAFEVEIAKSNTFETIEREETVTSVKKSHTFAENINDGAYYWRVRTKDEHEQWSEFSEPFLVNVNSDAPWGTIAINNNNLTTDDPNVELILSAGGTYPDVHEMIISNDPTGPKAGAIWEKYVTMKNWTLEKGLGEKSVHVWYRDDNGLKSPMVLDTITLEEKAFDIDKGALGWGKIGADPRGKGGVDVFYIVLVVVLVIVLIVVIFVIKNMGGGDYYDDDYYEEDEEEDDDLDVLEQIRRKRKKEMGVDIKEEKEEVEEEADEDEEKFERKAQGRYTDLSTEDDFTMGTSRYGVQKEEEKEEEKELTGPYSMKSLEDDFSLEPQRYGGPPSLDDFMKNIEDMDEKKEPEGIKSAYPDKEEEKTLFKEEAKKAREQIELLKNRRMDILDSLRSTTDSRRQKALEQQLDDIQQLIIGLRKHLPDEDEEEEAAPPPEEAEKIEVMDVPSDIKDQLKEGMKRDKKRVGGLGFLDKEEADTEEKTPEQPQMSPEVQARLQQILQQLRVLQQQQVAVQNQIRQNPDPGQQRILNQQAQVLAQQQQALQQEAQRLQQQSQQKALPEAKSAVSPEVEAKLAQILQQLQVLGQQKMAIQNQMRQTADPQMQQTLNQQYQTVSQQQQTLQQQAQLLQQQGAAPIEAAAVPTPEPAAPSNVEEKARQILQQLQVLAQQQMAIQNQMRQTADPAQQQALTQQLQSVQTQMEALKVQAAALHQGAQAQPTAPPPDETPPPTPVAAPSPETEAKMRQILQQLQAIQAQQAAIQNQLSQTQDPGQQQVLSSQYQTLHQQAMALKQQAEAAQQQAAGTPASPAQPQAQPPVPAQQQPPQAPAANTQAQYAAVAQQYQTLQQQGAAIQKQLQQARDPGQQQALMQQYQTVQQQLGPLTQQLQQLQTAQR